MGLAARATASGLAVVYVEIALPASVHRRAWESVSKSDHPGPSGQAVMGLLAAGPLSGCGGGKNEETRADVNLSPTSGSHLS